MKMKFEKEKTKFDWKAFAAWLLVIGVIVYLIWGWWKGGDEIGWNKDGWIIVKSH